MFPCHHQLSIACTLYLLHPWLDVEGDFKAAIWFLATWIVFGADDSRGSVDGEGTRGVEVLAEVDSRFERLQL